MFISSELLSLLILLTGTVVLGPEDLAHDELQINSWTANDQRSPALAAHAQGAMITVWQSINQGASGLDVFGQRLDKSGTQVGNEFRINEQVPGRQDAAQTVFGSDGALFVVFTGPVSTVSTTGIWLRRFDAQGQPPGGDELLYFDAESTQRLPRLASTGNSRLLVVWESQGNAPGSVIAVRGLWLDTDQDSPGEPFTLSEITSGHARWPAVAASVHGQAVVAWADSAQDGDSWGVFARCLSSHEGMAKPGFRVNQSTAGAQNQPSVAMHDDGRFAIAWWDDLGLSLTQDFYRRVNIRLYDSDCTPLTDELQVNQFDEGVQDVPAITTAPDGYIVAWQSYPESGFARQGTYARRVGEDGGFIGSEFRLNQEIEAYQDHPRVVATPDGGLFAVWETLGQDGSGFGVYGRLFLGPRVASITPVSGNDQTALTGEVFKQPLTVRVTDQWGRYMAGARLHFSVSRHGAAAYFSNGMTEYSAVTDSDGQAAVLLAAGSRPGNLDIVITTDQSGAAGVFKLAIERLVPLPVPATRPAALGVLIMLVLLAAIYAGLRKS